MITFIAPLIVEDTSKAEGYFKVALIVGMIGIAGSVIGAIGIKEHVTPQQKNGYQIKDITKIFSVKAVWTFFGAGLFSGLGVCLMATANTYYFSYVIGGMKLYSKVSILNSVAVIPALMSFLAKISMGFAGAIPGYLLQIAGFDSESSVQVQPVINIILLCTLLLPAIFQIIASLLMGINYPISKEKELELEKHRKISRIKN